jgi:hypothetical protein
MSSRHDPSFEAFLQDAEASFSDLGLDESPTEQELWQQLMADLAQTDGKNDLPNMFEDDEEMQMLPFLIDVYCEDTCKGEDFSEATLAYMANPSNEKSQTTYKRYQNLYLNYCSQDKARKPAEEPTLANFFTYLYDSELFSPGSFWCIYSTIRTHLLTTYGVNTKNFLRLKKLIKKFVDAHIVKKSDIFTYEEVKKALLELYDSNKPKELQFKIGK